MSTPVDSDGDLYQFQEFLKEFVDPDHGLLDKMRYKKALTTEEILEVEALPTYIRRNSKLLEYISAKSKCQEFLSALRESCQSHIANYVEGNGDYRVEFGNNWPLRDHQKSMLDVNEETLLDLLELDSGLLTNLYSMQVINKRQRQTITSKATEFQRNKSLLEMLRRCSISDYRKTIKCLHETNQSHIAELLEKGGVVVKIHSEIGDELTEDEIIVNFANVLHNKSLDEARRILESTLNVIALKKSNSIIIYILCKNVRELLHLRDMQLTGDLRLEVKKFFMLLLPPPKIMETTMDNLYATTESTFMQLLYKTQVDDVAANMSEIEYERCMTQFAMLESSAISKTGFSDLSLEMLDIILHKSYTRSTMCVANPIVLRKDEDMFLQLATVDYCWSQRMTRRRFKNSIWKKIRTNYRQKNHKYVIYRCNRQSLQESLRAFRKTTFSKSTRYQSAIDCAIFKNNRRRGDAFSLPLKSELEMNKFTRYLDQRGMKIGNKVTENGGAAFRVQILCFNVRNKTELNRQLVEGLNHVIHDYSSRSQDQKMTIDQLKSDGIEIMYAVEDRDVVVWILCKSPNAIERLQELDKSKRLLDLLRLLCYFNGKLFKAMKPTRVNIDDDQMKKETAGLSKITATFTENIDLEVPEMIYHGGITKLRDKIYVVCRHRRLDRHLYKVCVFEDQSPFAMENEIALEYEILITDIKSCENQNCLYVLETLSNCAWKIEPSGQMKPIINRLWLKCEQNFVLRALYVSRDNHLLAVTERCPVELRAYTNSAKLLLSIKLHEEIYRTWGLAESSIGNFLILHAIKESDRVNKTYEFCGAVSEVSRDGKTIIRRFSPRNSGQVLSSYETFYICDICIDSEERLFVPDAYQKRVIILDSFLEWIGVLIPPKDPRRNMNSRLHRTFYDERKQHLIILEDDVRISVYLLKRQYIFF